MSPPVSAFSPYPPSIDYRQWVELLKRITYKPNVKLVVSRRMSGPGYEDLTLEVRQTLPDACSAEPKEIVVGFVQPIPPLTDVTDALNFVRRCIERAELHEIDEWLRVDGTHVREPHPDQQRMRL